MDHIIIFYFFNWFPVVQSLQFWEMWLEIKPWRPGPAVFFFYLFKEFNGILHCFHLLKYVYMYIFFKAIFPCILYFTSRYMYVLWFHKVLKICYIETISIHFHRSQVHTPYNKPGISWKICKNILYHTSLFIYRVLSKYPKKVNVYLVNPQVERLYRKGWWRIK